MEGVLVKSLLLAETVKRRMEHFAIPYAEKVSTELGQFAGNTAQVSSEMMAHSATSHRPMEEV